jgi:hypothetical protein
MYTYIILFLPPIRICRDTSRYRIPSQSSSSHAQSLPLGIPFLENLIYSSFVRHYMASWYVHKTFEQDWHIQHYSNNVVAYCE